MKRIDAQDIVIFEELTAAALNEPDSAACIAYLLKREKISGRLIEFSSAFDKQLIARLYAKELQVIDRLLQERMQLLSEIDTYSSLRSARQTYHSHYPLPPFPSFFNKKD